MSSSATPHDAEFAMERQPTNDVLLLPTSDTSDGFRPKGTPLRGGVFVLANTLLGAGMLGLPAAFADCGYAVGLALLVFFASLGALGLTLLAYAADRAGRPASIYSVAEAALPGLGVLLDRRSRSSASASRRRT